MVHGPYDDFRKMAANRVVSDRMRRNAYFDFRARGMILLRQADALRASKALNAEYAVSDSTKTARIGELVGTVMALNEKNNAYRTWATVGKVGVCVGSVAVMVALLKMVLGPARPN